MVSEAPWVAWVIQGGGLVIFLMLGATLILCSELIFPTDRIPIANAVEIPLQHIPQPFQTMQIEAPSLMAEVQQQRSEGFSGLFEVAAKRIQGCLELGRRDPFGID